MAADAHMLNLESSYGFRASARVSHTVLLGASRTVSPTILIVALTFSSTPVLYVGIENQRSLESQIPRFSDLCETSDTRQACALGLTVQYRLGLGGRLPP